MKPPKCRVCGREEWNHVCAGIRATARFDDGQQPAKRVEEPKGSFQAEQPVRAAPPAKSAPKAAAKKLVAKQPDREPALVPRPKRKVRAAPKPETPLVENPGASSPARPSRVDYQRQMMHDVRAAKRAGLTTAEFRRRKAARARVGNQ